MYSDNFCFQNYSLVIGLNIFHYLMERTMALQQMTGKEHTFSFFSRFCPVFTYEDYPVSDKIGKITTNHPHLCWWWQKKLSKYTVFSLVRCILFNIKFKVRFLTSKLNFTRYHEPGAIDLSIHGLGVSMDSIYYLFASITVTDDSG